MFYDASTNKHGLPYNPFKAIVVPRPIGWISSVDAAGRVNLAPYSFFNAFADHPPIVGFCSNGFKDSVANVAETKEFVCNMATKALLQQVSLSSAPLPRGESEMGHAGLEPAPSHFVRPPRIAGIATALECRMLSITELTDVEGRPTDNHLVVGQVVGVYIDDRYIADGRLDTTAIQPLARLGYQDYAAIEEVFTLARPAGGGDAQFAARG